MGGHSSLWQVRSAPETSVLEFSVLVTELVLLQLVSEFWPLVASWKCVERKLCGVTSWAWSFCYESSVCYESGVRMV